MSIIMEIRAGLFSGCVRLRSVTIPAGVTKLHTNAFLDCESLTDVWYGGSEAQWRELAAQDGLFPASVTVHFA